MLCNVRIWPNLEVPPDCTGRTTIADWFPRGAGSSRTAAWENSGYWSTFNRHLDASTLYLRWNESFYAKFFLTFPRIFLRRTTVWSHKNTSSLCDTPSQSNVYHFVKTYKYAIFFITTTSNMCDIMPSVHAGSFMRDKSFEFIFHWKGGRTAWL